MEILAAVVNSIAHDADAQTIIDVGSGQVMKLNYTFSILLAGYSSAFKISFYLAFSLLLFMFQPCLS